MTRVLVRLLAAWMAFGTAGLASAQTTLTRTSAFEYDPASGLLIREIIEPSDSALCLVTTYLYDQYGNKIEATTRNCNGSASGGVTEAAAPSGDAVFVSRTSKTGYAAGSNWSAGQFPTSSKNALDHEETKEFDPRFGTVTKLTGPNQLMTTWAYDGFGRKINETRSDGTFTNWSYNLCTAGACPEFGKMFATETTAGAPTKKVYYDSLNREIRSEIEGFDGQAVFKDTKYDSLGRVDKVSKPYFTGAVPVWTTFQYDLLNRVIRADEPTMAQGTTRTETVYNGLVSTVTVSNAGAGTNMPEGVVQTRTTTKNSQGQVVQVTDTQGNNVTYAYDPFGNLKTTNAGGVISTLSYDLRGRKTGMVDPDMGTWSYVYNALGEMIRQTDAKNQVTTMAYDKLGRITNRTEPDLVSNWFYDAYQGGAVCNKGKGKLCQVTATNNYSRIITYDSLGRFSSVATSIDTSYSVSYTYDGLGRLNTTTYPTGFAVQNVYNVRGYLWKVQRVNDPDATVYWTANSQNAAGQITSEFLGNGLTTTYGYDALFRQSSVQSANAGGAVHSLTYDFDAIGNVKQRIDNVQAITENFSYDKLNRLIQASGPTLATRSFTYNAIGNMTYKSDVGTYTYPLPTAARPHAVSSVTNGGAPNSITASYTYDPNGNLISSSGTIYPAAGSVTFSRTLTYTSFNMPASIAHTQGASSYSYTYTYSVEHERVRLVTVRPDNTFTSIYLHPGGKGALLYEKEIRQSDGRIEHKHYVNGGSGLVGVFVTKSVYTAGDGPQMRYYHRDHLGSIAVITNPSGAVLERLSYEVFGERRNANGTPQNRASPLIGITTDRGYTGHEHLDELNLIHMNGRVYDPALGRFMTADPFLQAPDNLQSYNRYAYVLNNPLMYTDPSGYFSLKKAFKSITKPFEKAWKGVWHSEIGRAAVMIAAAYFTAGAASSWMISSATSGFMAGGGLSTAFVTLGGEAATLTGLGSALASAAGGFAAGFIGSGGDVEAGLRGALSSGLTGGIAGNFGDSYSLGRVAAESVAGGVSSVIQGGRFSDGLRSGLVFSGFTYLTVSARDYMLKNSRGFDGQIGFSDGYRGLGGKLGGGRINEEIFNRNYLPLVGGDFSREMAVAAYYANEGASYLGGHQGGMGTIFGIRYAAGGIIDKVVEAFSGPHDMANSWYWYNPNGTAKNLTGLAYGFGETLNAANVFLVGPVVGASLVPEHARWILAPR